MKKPVLLALCLSTLLLAGCGYRLVGKGGALPADIEKVSIPVFKNQTFETGLEAVVTDAVVASFMERGGLEVGDDSADARLLGTIVSCELKRLSYDREGIPNEYRIALGVEVELVGLRGNEVIFPSKKLSVEKDYNVGEDISDLFAERREVDHRNIQTREQSRQIALEMAAKDLAKQVASAMLDTF